jgi:hypothetical protein
MLESGLPVVDLLGRYFFSTKSTGGNGLLTLATLLVLECIYLGNQSLFCSPVVHGFDACGEGYSNFVDSPSAQRRLFPLRSFLTLSKFFGFSWFSFFNCSLRPHCTQSIIIQATIASFILILSSQSRVRDFSLFSLNLFLVSPSRFRKNYIHTFRREYERSVFQRGSSELS